MAFDDGKNLAESKSISKGSSRESEANNLTQDSQSLLHSNKIDAPEKESNAADKLHRERQALSVVRAGVGLTKYRGSSGSRALGVLDDASQAFKKNSNLQGVGKDLAVSEAKRRVVKGALKKMGLSNVMMGFNTLKQAKSIAKKLNEQVPAHRVEVYAVVIFIAITKDLIDITTVELLSIFDWGVDLMIWGVLVFFLWGKGTWKVRFVMYVTPVFEVIPGTGLIPMWTLCTIYAYFSESKRVKEYKENLQAVNKAVSKMGEP